MENSVAVPGNIPVKLVKWKVSVGSVIGHGTVLCVYEPENSNNQQRLRSNQVGTVKTLDAKEGDFVQNGKTLLVIGGCTHPTVMKDMCAECGADLREESGTPGQRKNPSDASVAMVHSIPELIISQKEALELGKADEQRLIRDKKLVLLVDLDQTLIHTTNDTVPANLKDVHHFQLYHGRNLLWYHTKFRPGTEKFLERISKQYELHICTFGVRMYAHTIAKLLDPDGKFFSHRILSRDECFNPTSKTGNLKALFPCGDSMVCIIDDREDVWRFSPSLVHVKPYLFFDGTADINAPCGLDKETWEGENNEEKEKSGEEKEKSSEEKKRQQRRSRAKVVKVLKKKPKDSSVQEKELEEKGEEVEKKDEEEVKKEEDEKVERMNEVEKKDQEVEKKDQEVEKMDQEVKKKDQEVKKKEQEVEKKDQEVEKMDQEVNKKDQEVNKKDQEVKKKDQEVNKKDQEVKKKDQEVEEEEEDEKKEQKKESKTGGKIENEERKEEDKNEKIEEKDEDMEVNENAKNEEEKKAEISQDGMKQDLKGSSDETEKKNKDKDSDYEEMIEWEDTDDYLVYLEDILQRIHTAYFQFYNQMIEKSADEKQLPDIKTVLPYVKKRVLRGVNIVFSGMIPINKNYEKSRAYIVAKNLGANIQISLEKDGDDRTTHVVAARDGTQKINDARKMKGVQIVNADWLWTCAYRWERVDEQLYQKLPPSNADPQNQDNLISSRGKRQQKKDGTAEAKSIAERRFSDSYNPLYRMSQDDIDSMDREVDEDEASSSSEEDVEEEIRQRVLNYGKYGGLNQDSSSEESMSADYPRGWGKSRKRKRSVEEEVTKEEGEEDKIEDEQDIEERHRIFKCGEESSDSSGDQSSVGSVDEEMAAAMEREFLALL